MYFYLTGRDTAGKNERKTWREDKRLRDRERERARKRFDGEQNSDLLVHFSDIMAKVVRVGLRLEPEGRQSVSPM